MTQFKFHTEHTQILGATVQNLLAQVDWRPGFVRPWNDVYIKLKSRPALWPTQAPVQLVPGLSRG
jgi:hypothetical protein